MQKDEREKIIQNLKDCGCDENTIERFMASYDIGMVKEALRILEIHRQELLDRFHKCNDSIGCLDYLVYQIEKKNA